MSVFAIIAIMIAPFMLEEYFLRRWYPAYFTRGICIFSAIIPANAVSREQLLPDCLERDVAPLTTTILVFHALAKNRIAFRECDALVSKRPQQYYLPVMRGLIEVDARRNQIRVKGLCSWSVLIVPPIFLVLAVMATAMAEAIAALLCCIVVFGTGYYVQRRAYRRVVDVIRTQTAAP